MGCALMWGMVPRGCKLECVRGGGWCGISVCAGTLGLNHVVHTPTNQPDCAPVSSRECIATMVALNAVVSPAPLFHLRAGGTGDCPQVKPPTPQS